MSPGWSWIGVSACSTTGAHRFGLKSPKAVNRANYPTADQSTVSSPSRHRAGRSSTGQPASRTAAAARIQRWRGPKVAYGAASRHALSRVWIRLWTGSPGTLWWISALGSRSASVAGRVQRGEPGGERQRTRARSRRAAPRTRAGRARRRCPRPARRRVRGRPASPPRPRSTSPSSYCRRTLNARTTAGRRPASSNPPRTNVSVGGSAAGAAAATRAGSISTPVTRTSARTRRSRSRSSTAVTGVAPNPRSTTSGSAASPEKTGQVYGDPVVDAAQPVGGRGAAGDHAPRTAPRYGAGDNPVHLVLGRLGERAEHQPVDVDVVRAGGAVDDRVGDVVGGQRLGHALVHLGRLLPRRRRSAPRRTRRCGPCPDRSRSPGSGGRTARAAACRSARSSRAWRRCSRRRPRTR